MITPDLVSYIWAQRQKGASDYIIKTGLYSQGWTEQDFNEAVATLPARSAKPQVNAEGTIVGADLRTMGQNAVWRTPDGKADMPGIPAIQRHKGLLKTIIWVGIVLILGVSVYLYRGIIGPMLMNWYDTAMPYWNTTVRVIRMSTDFSQH